MRNSETREVAWELYLAFMDAVKQTGGKVELGKDACGGTIVNKMLDILSEKRKNELNIKITLQ